MLKCDDLSILFAVIDDMQQDLLLLATLSAALVAMLVVIMAFIKWEQIQSCSVDEPPVCKSDVFAGCEVGAASIGGHAVHGYSLTWQL